MSVTKRTVDPAAEIMLERAEVLGLDTAFARAERIKPCPIGVSGSCCRQCAMGPCRLVGNTTRGVCGATLETVVARNVARMVAAGAAAHSDHGRDMALTLRAVAKGETKDYYIRDPRKLRRVAEILDVETEGRTDEEIALDVAEESLREFGKQDGELKYLRRAPAKRREVWAKAGITPRGIDREVVETMHRTIMGNDQEPEHLLDQAARTALSSGWGGSMLATDLTDILFGTPQPVVSEANLGVIEEDEVNIIVHGHEPFLSEQIVEAVRDPELLALAKAKGAKGINLAGICCTANEVLARQGIPSAGNFLHQELALITGAVDMMTVDVQCIMPSLADLSKELNTLFVTTSPKVDIPGAIHKPIAEEEAREAAWELVRMAIENFPNRKDKPVIPNIRSDVVAGYSHEYIEYMLGGRFRKSFWPLNDNIIGGRILGVAAVVGCNNPRQTQDEAIRRVIEGFISQNVLVLVTGCGALAAAKAGYLAPETLEKAGEGLKEVCEAIGISPVLHVGSCVDNSRLLTIMSAVVEAGGLGEDIADLPAVATCPEWMSEKALEIGVYAAASGVGTFFGPPSPIADSPEVVELMTTGWEKKFGGFLEFTDGPEAIVEKGIAHILKKRQALGINTARERVLYDMDARRNLA